MRKNIKNYSSLAPVEKTVIQIQQILGRAGARRLMFDYDPHGDVEAVAFIIKTSRGEIPVRLPARVDQVAQVMYGTHQSLSEVQQAQAKRTAWKNIQDWIDAQVALIESEMVRLEEIFLPYMVTPQGNTFFEAMEHKGFLLPEAGG